jgi:O-succinylbenzoic acid--CoA ligase
VEIDPWLPRAAARRPEELALETPEERVTYRELLMTATQAAGRLVTRGAHPGDRVALTLPFGRAYVEALHGCWLLRTPAMPIDPRLTETERTQMVRAVDVLVTAPLAGGGAPFNVGEPQEGELALIVHTSGTTRRARPVELTFGNLAAHVRASAVAVPLGPDDRWLCPMPLSHVGGLMVLVRSAAAAAAVVLEPFDADRTAQRLRDGEVTIASLVPTMLERVLEAGGHPGPTLRRILLGGGPVTRGLLERATKAGFPVSQTYGLTEACSTVTVAEAGDVETAGKPLPGIGVAIARDGEILVSGPTVVGEWNPLRTGDLGRLDDRGRLVVTGRKADTIVTGGENVAPSEVEAVLEDHPDVAEAAVFGREHPLWGEAVTAKIVPRAGARPTPAELRAHCSARLAGYKVPKAFELVDALPRTASGKLLRREL